MQSTRLEEERAGFNTHQCFLRRMAENSGELKSGRWQKHGVQTKNIIISIDKRQKTATAPKPKNRIHKLRKHNYI